MQPSKPSRFRLRQVPSSSRSLASRFAGALLALPLFACGEEVGTPSDVMRPRADATLDGTSSADSSLAVDTGVSATEDSGALDVPSDNNCGGASIAVTGSAPDVVILFDRSCSMARRWDARGSQQPVTAANFASSAEDPNGRWYVAREGVRTLVRRYPRDVAWGLMVFPEVNQGCGAMPSLSVRPSIGGGDAVLARLMDSRILPWTVCTLPITGMGTQPAETPTQEALQALQSVPELARRDRERLVILVSDGGATCGATDVSLRARTQALRAMGVRTAVVGFALGTELSTATPMLNAIAEAGGLPRAGGGNRFYEANSPGELAAALSSVITAAIPCTFRLASMPPDAMSIRVSLNDMPVSADPANGYSYDSASNSVTFHGASCGRIQSREVTRISVGYGCGQPMCVPVPEVCDGLDNDCDGMVDNGCRPG